MAEITLGELEFKINEERRELNIFKNREKIASLPITKEIFEALAGTAAHVRNLLPEREHRVFMFFVEDAVRDALDWTEMKKAREEKVEIIIEKACERIIRSEYYYQAMYSDVEEAVREVYEE